MKIAIVGGGPGGLYFAALMKGLDPRHDVTVWERNAPDDTFGFGVVFSDETLGGIEDADPVIHEKMERRFARWTDIDIEFNGRSFTIGGQGFAAMSRRELLLILQQRAAELGVRVRYQAVAPDVDELRAAHDLVVAADGLNSATRTKYADVFGPSLDRRANKYIWLGTDLVFEAFQFFVKQTEWGTMQIHGYPFSEAGSTFIAEMHEDVWRRAGFDRTADREFPPGTTDTGAVGRLREIWASELKGHAILTNNSKWLSFTTVRNRSWHAGNLVLLGDAAHTAHFSIGSGTKLAMEDALALAACLHERAGVEEALAAYQAERKPVVESTQRAAQASLEWFENIGMYTAQAPAQFCFNLLTRSRRITFENLKERDPEFAGRIEAAFAADSGGERSPAMFQPVAIGSLRLKNRVVVAPMDMYCAVDGVAGDFHLVHLGSKALGGAGLVMTEMACVSPEGRITPGCTGLYTDEQRDAYRKITDFVHARSTAKIGVQLGHSGRKGSTKLMWEGIDQPLDDGNWEVIGPSALAYGPGCHVPRAATREDLRTVAADFAAAARRAVAAGFDLVEVHAAHGYLLSSFLSPLANKRTDCYGGSLENRLRFPLEVFDAVRSALPAGFPVSVRISAHDWVAGGNTDDDAVEIARAFIARGADAIHVSSGQVAAEEQPAFGRSYQTPFADKIRARAAAGTGAKVIAVGAISSYDDVNSILLAGRADLCALGRTHLYDPQWPLHAAAEQDYTGAGADWPAQYLAGRRKPPTARTDKVPPRLQLLREGEGSQVHLRWRPGTSSSRTGACCTPAVPLRLAESPLRDLRPQRALPGPGVQPFPHVVSSLRVAGRGAFRRTAWINVTQAPSRCSQVSGMRSSSQSARCSGSASAAGRLSCPGRPARSPPCRAAAGGRAGRTARQSRGRQGSRRPPAPSCGPDADRAGSASYRLRTNAVTEHGGHMRDAALLGARLLLGSYMGIHASQKLFGKFHGPGLDGIGKIFEKNGLAPGREMAMAAAATEIAGGVLTVTGIADPAGPLAVMGAMSVAAAHNREGGLMAVRNGVELPVAYATLALTLAAAGPGKYKIGPSLPGRLAALGALAGGAAAGALIAKMVTSKPAPPEPVTEKEQP